MSAELLAELDQVEMHFGRHHRRARTGPVRAVDGVSLSIQSGRTFALVGESGSGKSTVARVLLRLLQPTAGRVLLGGVDVTDAKGADLRTLRRTVQMVFQDPYSSFDPMASLADSLVESLAGHADRRRDRYQAVPGALERVGLSPALMGRRPAELSGGQLQRAAIARALAVNPSIIALDEPLSSLDVSTQAQIVNLLREIQDQSGAAYLFISHDLSVVRHISHHVAVMYLGKIVEAGPVSAIYDRPRHPYTEALLSAVPIADPSRRRSRSRVALREDLPTPDRNQPGCRFRNRCPWAMPICEREDPPPTTTSEGTTVNCHLHTDGPRLAGETVRSLLDHPRSLP